MADLLTGKVNDECTEVEGLRCDCCQKTGNWEINDVFVKENGEWDVLRLHRWDLLVGNVGNFEDICYLVSCPHDNCTNHGRYYVNDRKLDTFYGVFGVL